MLFLDCWIKTLFLSRQVDKSRSRNSKNHSSVSPATVTVSLLFWERDQTPSLLLVWCDWTASSEQQWPHSCLVSWVMKSPSAGQLADGDECHEAQYATSNFSSLIQASMRLLPLPMFLALISASTPVELTQPLWASGGNRN